MSLFEDIARQLLDTEERTSRRGVRPEDANSQPEEYAANDLVEKLVLSMAKNQDLATSETPRRVLDYFTPNKDLANARRYRGVGPAGDPNTTDPEGRPRTDRDLIDRLTAVIDTRDSALTTALLSAADPVADEIGARGEQVRAALGGQSDGGREYEALRTEVRGVLDDEYKAKPGAAMGGLAARYLAMGAGSLSPAGIAARAGQGALAGGMTAMADSESSLSEDPAGAVGDAVLPSVVGAGLGSMMGGASKLKSGFAGGLKHAAKRTLTGAGIGAGIGYTLGDAEAGLKLGASFGLGLGSGVTGGVGRAVAPAVPALSSAAGRAITSLMSEPEDDQMYELPDSGEEIAEPGYDLPSTTDAEADDAAIYELPEEYQ